MTKPANALVCAALICAATAASANTSADSAGVVLHTTEGQVAVENSAAAHEVRPGDTFTITGDCIAPAKTPDMLRVVLTLADSVSGATPGFSSAIAIDQEMRANGLEVRVPDLPEAEDHVFDVRVFRLGSEMPLVCNAGSLRIGAAAGHKVG